MHACTILHKLLKPGLAHLDVRNARTLLLAVDALLSGRRLTLMELARHWPRAVRYRAPLKRIDRWLGNGRVQATRARLYEAALTWLLRMPRPILVVDWSELKSDGRWHLLRAGVVGRGRTLTVYEEVHPECREASPHVEAAFLRRLQALLPAGICPIVITDAGFRVPWFRVVEALNWHWVGRVRQRSRIKLVATFTAPYLWVAVKQLYAQATRRPLDFGPCELTESQRLRCRLVLVKKAKRGRLQCTRSGHKAQGGYALKMARRAREPWLLAASCSLENVAARHIVNLYAKRMQIEQSFRDLKSHRFGAAFEDTQTRTAERLQMLLLIHTLATLAAWLEGVARLSAALPTTGATHRARYSVVWIGWERLRQTARRLDVPIASATERLRQTVCAASNST